MRLIITSFVGILAAGYILESHNDPHASRLSYYERVLRWLQLSSAQSAAEEASRNGPTIRPEEGLSTPAGMTTNNIATPEPMNSLEEPSKTPERVVILVHGFLGVRGTMYPMAYALQKQTEHWTFVVPMGQTADPDTCTDAATLVQQGTYEPANGMTSPRTRKLWLDRGESTSGPSQEQFRKDTPFFVEVVNWSWPSRNKSLEDHAETFVQNLNKIIERRPNVSFTFVVHSCGASILRASLNHSLCPPAAKSSVAVLLAPCNRGSTFARRLNCGFPLLKSMSQILVGGNIGKQLMENPPEFFENLGSFPPEMKILVIRGGGRRINPYLEEENDGILTTSDMELPPSIAQSQDIKTDIVPLDHMLILYSPSVINKTIYFVRHATPQTIVGR